MGRNPQTLLAVLLPQDPHRVDTPLNPRLQATADLFRPTRLIGPCPRHQQHTLR